uniref:chlorophyllase n=1 Tax=Kalanchoe fedtschenkoi TaxID=63787 RepID=A0A7N0TU84_KALFE
MAATASPVVSVDAFQTGAYATVLQNVEPPGRCERSDSIIPRPPKALLIASPSGDREGEFPVLMLLHGFLLYNSFYSQLMQHIASHGFIVVAPQLYTLAGPDCTDEIDSAAEIACWFPKGLKHFLPQKIQPDLSKLALSGHSRGGKVAFALALRKTMLKFSALIGIDPVDGMDKGVQTPPPVLTYVPNSFDIGMPVIVIGSGLGEVKKNAVFPPCAPSGVNHWDFYIECKSPACYFVAKDYGHLDMLDDKTRGIRGAASYCLCMSGKSREPMRRFVGGAIVAFMKSYLGGEPEHLMLLKNQDIAAPLELQQVHFRL